VGPDSRKSRSGEDRRVLLVGDLLRSIEDQFRIAFPRRIWVLGVVRGLQGEAPVEFLLTEGVEGGPRRTLPAELSDAAAAGIDSTLRRLHDVAVEDLLVEGHLVRMGGLLSYDSELHTVVFSVTALDPEPTRAWLNDRRDSLRGAAQAARLGERQRDVRVPLAPASVGIVGGCDDAGLAQASRALAAEDFTLEVVEYPVTAVGADRSDALAMAVRQACAAQHDVVLLVRDGGRPLALAPLDAEQVVRAVADAPVPVITGLGSGGEPTAVDEVAHQMCTTAEEAAQAVLSRLRRADELVERAVVALAETGDDALRRAARRLEQTRSEVSEHARRARQRAERAKARRIRLTRAMAAVLALVVVVLAIVVKPWLAALLVIPVLLALFAERLRPRRRSSQMALDGLSFAAGLKRLGTIQQELDEAADPDDVERLEAQAAEVADHCRGLLRRPRPLRDPRPAAVATASSTQPAQLQDVGGQTESYQVADQGAPVSDEDKSVHLQQTQAIPLVERAGAGTSSTGTVPAGAVPAGTVRADAVDRGPREQSQEPETIELRSPETIDLRSGHAGRAHAAPADDTHPSGAVRAGAAGAGGDAVELRETGSGDTAELSDIAQPSDTAELSDPAQHRG